MLFFYIWILATWNIKMNWSKEWNDSVSIGVDLASEPDKTVLSYQHGNKQYSAEVTIIGDLALEYDDDGWNIFHVPTLTLFSKAVPAKNDYPSDIYLYEKDELLNWMKKVQENYPTAWTMLRCLTPETYADKGQHYKNIILNWCLSVKVE